MRASRAHPMAARPATLHRAHSPHWLGGCRRPQAAPQRRARAPAPCASAQPAALAPAPGSSQLPLRRLVLLRHADSSTDSKLRDHDREISQAGEREAQIIGRKIKEAGWEPDLVVASNSKRTKQTVTEMSRTMESLEDVDVHFMGCLYTVAALDGMTRQKLQECTLELVDDQKHSCVMLVGHNKGWEEAASSLSGQAIKLRTASAALLQVAAQSWSDVLTLEEPAWHLVGVLEPTS